MSSRWSDCDIVDFGLSISAKLGDLLRGGVTGSVKLAKEVAENVN